MKRLFYLCFGLALVTSATPLRAANKPHAGGEGQAIKVWTNDDIQKLRDVSPISIVGQPEADESTPDLPPQGYEEIQDPQWYAQRAARLRDDFQRRQAELREYLQTLDDARSLRETTGGVDLLRDDFATTPETAIETLRQRVNDTQAELDGLEDLARRNDIEPGVLRGQ